MKGILDAMHPVKRHKLHAQDIREIGNLPLDVRRPNGKVMQAFDPVHGVTPQKIVRPYRAVRGPY